MPGCVYERGHRLMVEAERVRPATPWPPTKASPRLPAVDSGGWRTPAPQGGTDTGRVVGGTGSTWRGSRGRAALLKPAPPPWAMRPLGEPNRACLRWGQPAQS
jgi:hypothetical protein